MRKPTLDYNVVLDELSGEKAFQYISRARELASKGFDVISFGVGQPDVPTPQFLVDEGKKALDERFTGYTETEGIKELRDAVAEYLNTRYGSDVKPEEVVITIGTKGAAYLAMAAYVRPGDEIIVTDPTYPVYSELPKFLNARPVYVPLRWLGEEFGFSLDVDLIHELITSKTKGIAIVNPHNPTGAVFSSKEIEEIMDLARDYNLLVIADEIYDNFLYEDADFKSFMSFPDWRDHVLYCNGFSKTFSMTGWRLGYIVARREVTKALTKLAVNTWSCPPSIAQKVGIKALKSDWSSVQEMVSLFDRRRKTICRELRQVKGFEVWCGKGAFYLFPRISKILEATGLDVETFVTNLMEKKHVVVLPGTAFPKEFGKDFIRFSYAVSEERIVEGVKRIREFIEEITLS
ncbi:MAG: pyridoxal phosphate-dependent aminotransferase [Zestosphaera sp.]